MGAGYDCPSQEEAQQRALCWAKERCGVLAVSGIGQSQAQEQRAVAYRVKKRAGWESEK
jgi:hypothetical protein